VPVGEAVTVGELCQSQHPEPSTVPGVNSAPPPPLVPAASSFGGKWVLGARPRTLPTAAVSVAVGTAVAAVHGPIIAWRAVAALIVGLALQIGVNYANDYSDGVKGTDDARVGPVRLVASGLASASSVKRAAFAAFGVAAVVGLGLAVVTTWWLIAVGLSAIIAAWTYTGGPKPYGYAGFGELFVFVYFGVVATVGSAYVHEEKLSALAMLASVPVGLLAVGLIIVNNLRDIPGDTEAGKRTLAVKLGDDNTRLLYQVCLLLAFACVPLLWAASHGVWVMLALGALAATIQPVKTVRSGAKGRELIAVLGGTARVQLVFGILLCVGLLITR
jgi:1,4-dihydroxy-2-naphthoate polyprenyltransferase